MRILHVINQMWHSGAETSLRQLLLTMSDERVSHELVSLSSDRNDFEALRAHGIRCAAPTTPLRGRGGAVRYLRASIRRSRPDLVHTTLFEADLAGRLAAASCRVPVLTSVVNSQYSAAALGSARNPRKLRAAQAVDVVLARLATAHVHAITDAVADDASRALRVPRERFRVVPRGRSLDSLGGPPSEHRRHSTRRALGIDGDVPIIVHVGRQEPQKAHVDLIHAFDVVAGDHPEALLLLAGRDGNSSSDIHDALAGCGSRDRVHLLGHRDDVGDLLCAADVFAFPSHWEGLGGAVIEAMAMGVPVVASDVPALREVLDDGRCGLLVPPGDRMALAGAIARLVDERWRADELARLAALRFESTYTLEQSARGMERMYIDIARVEGTL